MRLIPEWKKSLRMFSVQAMLVAGAIQGAYIALPSDMQAMIPDGWMRVITFAVLGLGVIGRLINQPKVRE